MSRLARTSLPWLACTILACGGGQSGTGDQPVIALVGATTSPQDNPSASFGVELDPPSVQPLPSLATSCEGATIAVGACCFYPVQHGAVILRRQGADPAGPQPSAGLITLVDATSSAHIGAWDYDDQSGRYDSLPASFTPLPWNPGDKLVASAAGAHGGPGAPIGPFTISAPALAAPSTLAPPPIARGDSLQLSWVPDPNATTMSVSLTDNLVAGEVDCVAPDSQGSVTLDASLLAPLTTGPIQIGIARLAQWQVSVPGGVVLFQSEGDVTLQTSLQ
jgi:hypothetical protein